MTTGAYWNVENPDKPWGPLDPDDVLTIPFDFAEWLTGQGTTYASHNLTPAAGLDAVTVSTVAGVILVKVSKAVGGTLAVGEKYGVTCQIVAADTQKRSKTLYLKIKEL
jgi:hypothetical protein